MIAAIAFAAALQQTPSTPQDLSYMETYACAALAEAARSTLYEGGTSPVTTSERAMDAALLSLEERATAALPAARAREDIADDKIDIEHGAARELLAMLNEEQLIEALDLCGAVFQVEAPE